MNDLNQNIRLLFQDKILAKILLPIIPLYVLPNHITLLRFIFAPLVLYLVYKGKLVIGIIFFILVAFTDVLDGSLARVRRQITVCVIVHDPLADKILISGFILILVLNNLGKGLAFLIIGLELIIILGAIYLNWKRILKPATMWGKIKMNLQVFAISLIMVGLFLKIPIFFTFSYWVFIASLCFSMIILLKGLIEIMLLF